jgi:hypothetical protein
MSIFPENHPVDRFHFFPEFHIEPTEKQCPQPASSFESPIHSGLFWPWDQIPEGQDVEILPEAPYP